MVPLRGASFTPVVTMKSAVVLIVFATACHGALASPSITFRQKVMTPQKAAAANAGINVGRVATSLATGLASSAVGVAGGALARIPIVGPLAQFGTRMAQMGIEAGNAFGQMGMGVGQMMVNNKVGAGQQIAGIRFPNGQVGNAGSLGVFPNQQIFPIGQNQQLGIIPNGLNQQLGLPLGQLQQAISQLGANPQQRFPINLNPQLGFSISGNLQPGTPMIQNQQQRFPNSLTMQQGLPLQQQFVTGQNLQQGFPIGQTQNQQLIPVGSQMGMALNNGQTHNIMNTQGSWGNDVGFNLNMDINPWWEENSEFGNTPPAVYIGM